MEHLPGDFRHAPGGYYDRVVGQFAARAVAFADAFLHGLDLRLQQRVQLQFVVEHGAFARGQFYAVEPREPAFAEQVREDGPLDPGCRSMRLWMRLRVIVRSRVSQRRWRSRFFLARTAGRAHARG